jgi:hypothetical protein
LIGVVYLFLWLGLATLNYFALSRIIARAGFSPWWVLCPITPLALVIILFLMLIVDAHTPSFGTGGFDARISGDLTLTYLIVITSLLNWVLFLVFAFVRWPVQSAAEGYGRRTPPAGPPFVPPLGLALPAQPLGDGAAPPPVPATGPGVSAAAPVPVAASPMVATYVQQSSADLYADPLAVGVLTAEPPMPTAPATIFCSWCGEERASDSHAIHYCGPTDRPATHCMRCGTTFDGAPACPSCGTPASELSKASRRR